MLQLQTYRQLFQLADEVAVLGEAATATQHPDDWDRFQQADHVLRREAAAFPEAPRRRR